MSDGADLDLDDDIFPINRPGEAHDASRPTVLIVDDDHGVVRALATRCKKLGLNVVEANDGLQAVLRAKQHHPDLTIVDVNMPEIDGFRVCEWLLSPERPGMEMIVLTGNQDADTYDRCEAMGAFFVAKNSDSWSVIRSIMVRVLGLEDSETAVDPRIRLKNRIAFPTDGPRILVVDDDADMARAIEIRLKEMGATVYVAYDGIEAYRIAVREQPHVVIADYWMPKAGGHYLIWRLRDTEATNDIPILVVTGANSSGEGQKVNPEQLLGSGGVKQIYYKPVDMKALLGQVHELCAKQFAQVERARA